MKRFLPLLFLFVILLTSCAAGTYIPDQNSSFSILLENRELFDRAVEETKANGFNCTVSSTVYYNPESVSSLTGTYIINMESNTAEKYQSAAFASLSENCSVKVIDLVVKEDGLLICSFDFCKPGRDYDYGIYYVSEDRPIYFGDPSAPLTRDQNGFSYTVKTGMGSSMTYYTEQISDHYYYYEIS